MTLQPRNLLVYLARILMEFHKSFELLYFVFESLDLLVFAGAQGVGSLFVSKLLSHLFELSLNNIDSLLKQSIRVPQPYDLHLFVPDCLLQAAHLHILLSDSLEKSIRIVTTF